MNAVRQPAAVAARDLRAVMLGDVILPEDEGYDEARQIFSGAVTSCPALFALCETPQDVQAAVQVARKHGLPLSVRGGGHDWAGRALLHNGIVIDLSQMRNVAVDARSQIAAIEGGATARDVMEAVTPHGLAAVTGNCGSVGMAGLTLGGGYSPLGPRYGLAVDNLLGAEIVLANGELVSADASHNPDLFWALRGGGGNFGVVTSMRINLHALHEVLAGLIVFPWAQADSVLRKYDKIAMSMPDELAAVVGFLTAPDGALSALIAPIWCGESKLGEDVIGQLQSLGSPSFAQIGRMSCLEMLNMFDANIVKGRHYEIQTRSLARLTPGVIAELTAAGDNRTSPSSMVVWHHFHGAPTRIPLSETAFGLRAEHFMVEIIAAWEPGAADDGRIHRQWARTLSQNLAPYAFPGGYPNMLGPGEHGQIAFAYGGNLARLQQAKKRFDPDDIFSSAISLPGGAPRRAITPLKQI
jgi:hypothetical protein